MSGEHEFIYYEDDSDYSSEDSESRGYGGMSGGIRETKYVQAGTNNVSDPYHYNEMMGISSAGGRSKHLQRLAKAGEIMSIASVGGKRPKIGKQIAKAGKSVGKAIYKEAKPIIVAEGKKALKEGIKNMMANDDLEGAGMKRGRGRPRKNVMVDSEIYPHQDGGKRQLGKKLGAMMPDDLIQEGFKRGLEFARQNSKSGGKFHIGKALKKVAKNEYAQDFASGAVGLGVGAATGNPLLAVGAATGTKAGLDAASGGKRGGGSTRGAIVGKIMKEKGLSLPLASKYVKEHNLY
jgi:hypothetical protein